MSDNDKHIIDLSLNIESADQNAWMLTFADLLGLMLAFFILLYSMSVITTSAWEDIVESLSNKLDPQYYDDQTEHAAPLGIKRVDLKNALDLDYLNTIMQEKIDQDGFMSQSVMLTRLDDRLRIRIDSSTIFSNESAALTSDAQLILFGVGNVLQQVGNSIQIYVATNDIALQESEYPSHWELSLARAIIVGEELRKFGNSSVINAFGHVPPTYGNKSESRAFATPDQAKGDVVDIIVRQHAATKLR